jgi:putative transposase
MPVVLRGRKSKKRGKTTGLRAFRRQAAGWYSYTHRDKTTSVSISICVAYKSYTPQKSGKKKKKSGKRTYKKLLFAAWGVKRSPRATCERYRRRFGIESSYRQLQQARFRRLLEWLAMYAYLQLHDHSPPCVEIDV